MNNRGHRTVQTVMPDALQYASAVPPMEVEESGGGFSILQAWYMVRAHLLLSLGIFVSLVSFLVAGLFLHAAYPRYLWILVGFGFAAGKLARKAALSAPNS